MDSGASGYAFIDRKFTASCSLITKILEALITLRLFNGEITSSGTITEELTGYLSVKQHSEEISLLVTQLSDYAIVLGAQWLRRHDPLISWPQEEVKFTSSYCRMHCFDSSLTTSKPETVKPTGNVTDITMIGAAAYSTLARKPGYHIFAASMADIEKALEPKKEVDPLTILPEEYHEFIDVFSRKESDILPPHRPYDHKITLKDSSSLPFSRLYPISRDKLLVLHKYLREHLNKDFIKASLSPVASPVLFVKKPGGGLRLYVDYRALNALTVKNQYPLPLIRETLDRLAKAKYFTKLDVIAAFNRIRMAKGDEYLTAFRTRYGLFEYNVMPFGLTGAPSTFQHYINDSLREYLDIFCTAYLDDILIYSESLSEHQDHVRKVLTRLRKAGLQIDIEKCEFHTQETRYLGHIISIEGIKMDSKKIKTVKI